MLLTKNSTLRKLALRGNQIDDEGAIVLANAITQNKTLQNLELNWNNIGDRGTIALASAIKKRRVFSLIYGRIKLAIQVTVISTINLYLFLIISTKNHTLEC